ncbi:MAG: hypothetical protein J5501_10965 [Ruminococcus sp.]|nr:hypothetical protein [Ruminococcus sp.]
MTILYILIVLTLVFLLWMSRGMEKKEKFRKRFGDRTDIAAFLIRSCLGVLLVEFGLFNMNSLHLLGDYPQKTLSISSAYTENIVSSSSGASMNYDAGSCVIEYNGPGVPVGTLTLPFTSDKKSFVHVSIDIKDATQSGSYRYGVASADIITGNERSMTIPCNFSGDVSALRISFSADSGERIELGDIIINKPIGIHFSLIRFLIMFLGCFFIYALSSDKLLRRKYELRKKSVKAIAWGFTGCLIILSLFLTNMSRYRDPNHSIAKDLKSSYGNQISQEIVDAFEAGRVDLNTPINTKLTALDNPYDWSQRTDEIGSYPWDHLLFEGKYYSYYGIAPVLTLFLPYHKITGYYFPSSWAVWLYGVFGIIFLTLMYLSFADKFFTKINASLVLIGFAIVQMSSGIFFNYYYANFYEIAQASGFFWTVAGAYFMVSSNVIGDGKISKIRLALSTSCLSMAVLCRPTLAVYCVAALLFIYAGFRKLRGEKGSAPKKAAKDKKDEKKEKASGKGYVPYFLCAILPFVLIGSIQVWYNWVRFGNPLDFGIQYSLTINDFINAQYHTHFALLGIYSYILCYPEFSEHFPFMLAGGAKTFNANGYYFIATGAALGLLWRALPLTAYAHTCRAYRVSDNKNKKLYSILLAAVCIVCPFIIIFSIWESGYCTRYCCDFAWEMILGSLIIMFVLWSRCKENTQRHINTLMIIAGIVSLIMNFVQIYTYSSPDTNFSTEWYSNVLTFGRLFEFWR